KKKKKKKKEQVDQRSASPMESQLHLSRQASNTSFTYIDISDGALSAPSLQYSPIQADTLALGKGAPPFATRAKSTNELLSQPQSAPFHPHAKAHPQPLSLLHDAEEREKKGTEEKGNKKKNKKEDEKDTDNDTEKSQKALLPLLSSTTSEKHTKVKLKAGPHPGHIGTTVSTVITVSSKTPSLGHSNQSSSILTLKSMKSADDCLTKINATKQKRKHIRQKNQTSNDDNKDDDNDNDNDNDNDDDDNLVVMDAQEMEERERKLHNTQSTVSQLNSPERSDNARSQAVGHRQRDDANFKEEAMFSFEDDVITELLQQSSHSTSASTHQAQITTNVQQAKAATGNSLTQDSTLL
ncbi:hypothetical protein RFI_12578, partial [Reticulomyxa filosa]